MNPAEQMGSEELNRHSDVMPYSWCVKWRLSSSFSQWRNPNSWNEMSAFNCFPGILWWVCMLLKTLQIVSVCLRCESPPSVSVCLTMCPYWQSLVVLRWSYVLVPEFFFLPVVFCFASPAAPPDVLTAICNKADVCQRLYTVVLLWFRLIKLMQLLL